MRDHPRVCGEHDGQYFRILGSVGSSPRVRGTHVRHRRAEGVHGIIPACAGNTPSILVSSTDKRGSSPRVRGTRPLDNRIVLIDGIIPACAGNTAPRMIKRASSRDHPRVCGEHMGTLHVSDAAVGLSPRVRGTPVFSPSVCVRFGIIPACAGNTRVLALRLREVRDHPRVCGEHSAGISASQNALGSSPRVRGTHGQLGVLHHDVGISPACAGNTPRSSSCSARRRDHPRVCGEHEFSASSSAIRAGSSPRVRGTRGLGILLRQLGGVIPACAGNTVLGSGFLERGQDHPRVCGEHTRAALGAARGSGSSPRVRGTPHRRAAEGARRGIIPACAGNTERPGSAITTTWDHPRVCGEHTP